MVSNLTPNIRISRHKAFLNSNWWAIAAFAYKEYMAKGKGIVAVIEEDFVNASEPALAPIRFKYFTGEEATRLMPDYHGSKEEGWVSAYDPAEKVIATVVRYDSGVSSYLIGAKPSPKDIHEAGTAG